MQWLGKKKPVEMPSAVFAKVLFDITATEIERTQPEEFRLQASIRPAFRNKLQLYIESIFYIVLYKKAQEHPQLKKVWEFYHFHVTPADDRDFEQKLASMAKALKHIDQLLLDQVDETVWAYSWLADVGCEQGDALVFYHFAEYWKFITDLFDRTLNKALAECVIVE